MDDPRPSIIAVAGLMHSWPRLESIAVIRHGPIRLTELVRHLELAMNSVWRDLGLLEACGLVSTEKKGRCRICSLGPNLVPIPTQHGGLILRVSCVHDSVFALELSVEDVARLDRHKPIASGQAAPLRAGHAEPKARTTRLDRSEELAAPDPSRNGVAPLTRRGIARAPTDRGPSSTRRPSARG